MKKTILTTLSFVPTLAFAAGNVLLEGNFKVGPAIILICILVLFVMVGIFFRAKDTTDFYAA